MFIREQEPISKKDSKLLQMTSTWWTFVDRQWYNSKEYGVVSYERILNLLFFFGGLATLLEDLISREQ